MNNNQKKGEAQYKIRWAFKKIKMVNPKTIESREIIEYVIKHGALYKYQKVLLLVEILTKLNEGYYK